MFTSIATFLIQSYFSYLSLLLLFDMQDQELPGFPHLIRCLKHGFVAYTFFGLKAKKTGSNLKIFPFPVALSSSLDVAPWGKIKCYSCFYKNDLALNRVETIWRL